MEKRRKNRPYPGKGRPSGGKGGDRGDRRPPRDGGDDRRRPPRGDKGSDSSRPPRGDKGADRGRPYRDKRDDRSRRSEGRDDYRRDRGSGNKPAAQGAAPRQPSARSAPVRGPSVRGSSVRGPSVRGNVWGIHAVEQAWLNPARRIKNFYTTEQALKEFLPVYEQAKSEGLKRPMPLVVDKGDLDRGLPSGAVHQGLALDAEPLEENFLQDMIIAAQGRARTVLVMLDQVTDPHNVGAIIRSASAFGAHGIVMQTRHAPEVTGTLAKAASGAVEHMPLAYETNLGRAMAELQEAGFVAAGLDERGEKDIGALPAHAKILLVLGAEGKGLRQNLRENCDILARLPTHAPILSLNVSNAAAVALYAVMNAA